MSFPYGGQSMVAPLRRVLVHRQDTAFGGADPAVWHYTSRPRFRFVAGKRRLSPLLCLDSGL